MTYNWVFDLQNAYQLNGLLPGTTSNPYVEIDQHTVGRMLEAAIRTIRLINRHIEVCVSGGAHCDSLNSVAYMTSIGVDTVVCNEDRAVMAVRMKIVQTAIKMSGGE